MCGDVTFPNLYRSLSPAAVADVEAPHVHVSSALSESMEAPHPQFSRHGSIIAAGMPSSLTVAHSSSGTGHFRIVDPSDSHAAKPSDEPAEEVWCLLVDAWAQRPFRKGRLAGGMRGTPVRLCHVRPNRTPNRQPESSFFPGARGLLFWGNYPRLCP